MVVTARLALWWPFRLPLYDRKKPFGPYTDRSYSGLSPSSQLSETAACAPTVYVQGPLPSPERTWNTAAARPVLPKWIVTVRAPG